MAAEGNIASGGTNNSGGAGGGTGVQTPANTGGAGNAGGNGTAPNPATGAAGGNANGTGAGTEKSWRDSLPEEIRNDPSLVSFKSHEELAKSYVHAQSLIGKEKVIVPGEKATDADWDAFYAKAGRPESAEKYGLKIEQLGPEGNKELSEAAFKLGLSPKQLNGLAQWSEANNKKQLETFQANQKLAQKNGMEAYVKELGGKENFDAAFAKAADALLFTGDKDFIEYLDKSGLGSEPKMIKFFASLAERMKEDGIKGHGGTEFGSKLSEVKDKLENLRAHPSFGDGDHAQHAATMVTYKELLELQVALRNKAN